MSRNTSVRSSHISIEPLQRKMVQEFTMDGQEIYEEKLSLQDQLSRNVQRLDFSRDLDTGAYAGKLAEEESDRTKNLVLEINQAKTAFEAPRDSLRKAYFEISILSDLLMVLNKCPRYLQLKEVKSQSSQTPLDRQLPPHKSATPGKSLIKAREALRGAADILLKGANELTSCLGARNGSEHAFHDCLWSLRERWRLVRSQDSIMGDLTYNSSMSRIQEVKARYLVRKTPDPIRSRRGVDDMDVDVPLVPFCPVTLDIPHELLTRSALFVYLHSEPVKTKPELDWDKMEKEGLYGLCPPADLPEWQRPLYKAQLSFFHHELFTQLMIDAYSPDQERPVYVCEGQLHIQLRPGRWLSLQSIQENDRSTNNDTNTEPTPEPNRALYLFACDALLQLLRETQRVAHPVPATAQFVPLDTRLEGPNAAYIPVSCESMVSSKSKHSSSSSSSLPLTNIRVSQEPRVLSKLQEGVLRIELVSFISSTCRLVNSDLTSSPIPVELDFPLNAFPTNQRVPIYEKYSQTELCCLKIDPRAGKLCNIVPIGTGQNSVQFPIDSPRFKVFIARTILQFWTNQILNYFTLGSDWLLMSVSALQPFLPAIKLKSVVTFQHSVTSNVVQVAVSYPHEFLISSGSELASNTFDSVALDNFKGDTIQEKLHDYFSSQM